MKKINSIIFLGLGLALSLASCDSGDRRRTPGHIYAPDMTYSRAYETYTSNPNFKDGLTNRLPVEGTVAKGHQLPDHLMEGDTVAYKTFNTSLKFTPEELKEGGRLFNIYCAICHGTGLDGNGPLYSSGKFAAMPANFKDGKYINMPVGQMFAAIKYGKNMMGSYASQLDIKQRWMVIAYMKQFQSQNGGAPFTFAASEAKSMDTKDSLAAAGYVLVNKLDPDTGDVIGKMYVKKNDKVKAKKHRRNEDY